MKRSRSMAPAFTHKRDTELHRLGLVAEDLVPGANRSRASRRFEATRSLPWDPKPAPAAPLWGEVEEPARPVVPPPLNVERTKRPPTSRTPHLVGDGKAKTVVQLYHLQDGLCFICREPMRPTAVRKKRAGHYDLGWTREHLVPRSRGGGSGRNIVLSHHKCNCDKGNRMPTARELEIAEHLHNGVPLARFPKD